MVDTPLISLLPACLFRYRFFSTASITQSRYYYLSSIGSLLVLTLLLSILWNGRSRLRRAACAVLFVLLVAGWMLRVHRLEKKWSDFTGMYRSAVSSLVAEIERHPGFGTVTIENPPLAFPYIADAVLLETGSRIGARRSDGASAHPPYEIIEVRGGAVPGDVMRPCLYISYSSGYPQKMKVEVLE